MFESVIYIINCRRKAKDESVWHVVNVFVIMLSHPMLEIQVLGIEIKILLENRRSFKQVVLVKLSKCVLSTWSMSEFGFSQMGKVSNNSVSFLLNFCSWLYGKKSSIWKALWTWKKLYFLCCNSKIRWKNVILQVTDASLESSYALGLALLVGLWTEDCHWVQTYQTECSP